MIASKQRRHPIRRGDGDLAKTGSMQTDWRHALATLKSDLNLPEEAIGLLALQLKFRLEDIQTVAAEAITGGGDDKKCDIVYVDKELQIGVVAQCYEAISKKKTEAPANKASDLNAAISWLLTSEIDDLPEGLKGRADEFRSAINSGEIKQIYIWYVHNLNSSKNVENELKQVEKTTRLALRTFKSSSEINIFAEEIGDKEISRFYSQAERAVIVTDILETRVPDAIEIKSNDWSSVVTTVSGDWLSSLYSKYQTDLFSANLRGYLGSRTSDSNINNGIKGTAEHDPGNFWVYNNGITALVLDYSLGKRTSKGIKLSITGISIVNGAQTTGSLGSLGSVPPALQVPVRFVKSPKESIVSNIVRYNNSQNKLQAADFRSTDQIQERLRQEFSKIPNAEYDGGRRGGASDAIKRSKYALPSYTVGQSITAFHGDPVTAYDKKSEIWTNESFYRRVFTDRTSARHVVFVFSLLDQINSRRLALTQKHRKDEESLSQIEKSHLRFLNKKGASYLIVDVIAKSIETILGRAIPNKFNLQFRGNVSPAAAAKFWAPIVDLVLSLSNQLDGAFSRGRITNEAVQKTVPNFIGVVESLKAIHQQTFADFAKQVELVK